MIYSGSYHEDTTGGSRRVLKWERSESESGISSRWQQCVEFEFSTFYIRVVEVIRLVLRQTLFQTVYGCSPFLFSLSETGDKKILSREFMSSFCLLVRLNRKLIAFHLQAEDMMAIRLSPLVVRSCSRRQYGTGLASYHANFRHLFNTVNNYVRSQKSIQFKLIGLVNQWTTMTALKYWKCVIKNWCA